ncbi:MAG: hypothetical protein KAX55_04575 [Propionivibrio sp.]|nr:hypothetical protein [Propionivibrio sp.]
MWREGSDDSGEAKLHLLSANDHRVVSFPEIADNPESIEDFLPTLGRLAPAPIAGCRWFLLLEPGLPEAWFGLRWESLTLAGQSLSSQALVVRGARWDDRGGNASISVKPARILDVFPKDEYSFLEHFQPHIRAGKLRRCRLASLREEMAESEELFILAHGRAEGLLDATNNPFDIPIAHPMPRRIWLLACNVDGGMHAVARSLLEMGCRTVIAATSLLSAPEMAALVDARMADDTGRDDHLSWLANRDQSSSGDGGVRELTIWGNVGLDRSHSAPWNRLTWDNEHGKGLCPPLDDETTQDEFHAAYANIMSAQAWSLTQRSLLAPLLWLAEKHHHPAMQSLASRLRDQESPQAIRALAVGARRVGNYVSMARFIARGLTSQNLVAREKAGYLGDLANLFIDLNLPGSALAAIEQHEECCLSLDANDLFMAQFKSLDWRARAEARRGRLEIALDLMTAKRKQAVTDTGRELAWQLYLCAWAQRAGQIPHGKAADFACEIIERLDTTCPQDIGHGNENAAYLLRALAAYAWSAGDKDATRIATTWKTLAENRLVDDDPGPWAYVLAYLHLQGAVSSGGFDRAISALERTRYYLEAAKLASLAGRKNESSRLLGRFQARRSGVVEALTGFRGLLVEDELTESAFQRESMAVIHHPPEETVRCGTLPL